MNSSAAKKAWATRRKHGETSKHAPTSESKNKKWMGKAVKRPGALRAKVEERYGRNGFDKKGRIKMSVLQEMASSPDALTRQQVQFRLRTAKVHR